MAIDVNFIIGINEEELEGLKGGYPVIAKMILSDEDHRIFKYRQGDKIQAETDHGDRLWCSIQALEMIKGKDEVIAIFTLTQLGLN